MRRGILSLISSIFDPLGFVAPLILPPKAILRDLCQKGLDWDDRIPLEDLERWQDWLQELPKLEQFAVERCLKPKNFGRIVSSQLHNFSDASCCRSDRPTLPFAFWTFWSRICAVFDQKELLDYQRKSRSEKSSQWLF